MEKEIENLQTKLEEKNEARILRFCYEWNGDGNPNLAIQAAKFAYESGGNIKFEIRK